MKNLFDQPRGGMSAIRKAHCKAKAHELLGKLWIGAPDEIDLVALAHKAGRLRIVDGDPCISVGGVIRWAVRSEDFWPCVRTGNVHPHSAAGEIVAGK